MNVKARFEQGVKTLQTKCDIFVNADRLTEGAFGYKIDVTMCERRNTMDSGSIPGRSTQFNKPFPGVFRSLAG